MKKLLLGISFIGFAIVAHGQGTIAFGNSALTRICIIMPGGTPGGNPYRVATAADGLNFYVFFGPAGTTDPSALTQVQQPAPLATIGPVPGVMINAPSVFALPGTEGGRVVSLQIRGWNVDRTVSFSTDIRQVTLGPTAGPGQVIWQTATGTNPNRFTPLCIPEPSTLALGALGGLLLLFLRRKSTRK